MPSRPQYDSEQLAALQAYDRKAASRSTPGTWIVAAIIAAAAIMWIVLLVSRSHHTSAPPRDSFTTTAAALNASRGKDVTS